MTGPRRGFGAPSGVDAAVRAATDDDIEEFAWALCELEYPSCDLDVYRERLDVIASDVDGDDQLALRRAVAIRAGLGGNVEDYYDPRNSFLVDVLDRRLGIPISLSIVWMAVGRRAGIDVEGVGLPGHFLVYAAGQLCDPFHGGEAIGSDEAAALVAHAMGGEPRLDRRWLRPVATPEIALRVIRNLERTTLDRSQDRPWLSACGERLAEVVAAQREIGDADDDPPEW